MMAPSGFHSNHLCDHILLNVTCRENHLRSKTSDGSLLLVKKLTKKLAENTDNAE